ncbi:hypothetical protein C5E43_17170 [Nocardia cyriacigeorgica]|nr:hypothetical protein C5B73_04865 [Nocardia cyriacigeorgica]PPJ08170.1 hypothetical protein C5E43_17170 [Nocardia cyriacigeorgica]
MRGAVADLRYISVRWHAGTGWRERRFVDGVQCGHRSQSCLLASIVDLTFVFAVDEPRQDRLFRVVGISLYLNDCRWRLYCGANRFCCPGSSIESVTDRTENLTDLVRRRGELGHGGLSCVRRRSLPETVAEDAVEPHQVEGREIHQLGVTLVPDAAQGLQTGRIEPAGPVDGVVERLVSHALEVFERADVVRVDTGAEVDELLVPTGSPAERVGHFSPRGLHSVLVEHVLEARDRDRSRLMIVAHTIPHIAGYYDSQSTRSG